MSEIVKIDELGRVKQSGGHKRAPAIVMVCHVAGGHSFLAISLKSPPGQFNVAQARELSALLWKGADILAAANEDQK